MSEGLNLLMALFVICSPYVAVPIMIGLTKGQSKEEKRKVAKVASCAVAVILVGFAWIGAPLFSLFGIRLAALQLGGGIVVFLLGLNALKSKEGEPAEIGESIAVVPLAMPLMAGPGGISQVIIAAEEFPGALNRIYITGIVLILSVLIWVCLFFAGLLEKVLGVTGLNILRNLGGLVLIAIAVETAIKGIFGFFPNL